MKIKQTIRNMVLGAVLIVPVFATFAVASPSYAVSKCGGVETALISCPQDGSEGKTSEETTQNSGVWGLLILAVNLLTAGVGVVALGGIVYGAILYTSAGGNPEQVKKARSVLLNVVIGVVAFAGMFALLNFIVPGGVFDQP